ncbi:Cys-tRNA(Pro) deacylase [Symbiobacterium thermophilum]|uniref:Cys-tRNA(Pro) deacylase n=1 Tax=Symbiobacterium thermophilum TaxID=2734 RepID=UPI0035C7366D
MKTIAARILDQMKIPYEIRTYEWSEEEMDAVSVARKIGLPPEQVFKTLVVRGDRTGVLVASIPGNAELDLKRLAAVSGNKKVEMVPVKEIQGLTGYIRGGVSPLGMKKQYPYYLDQTAEIVERLAVSAGQRGLQLILSGPDLIRATGAKLADIAR